MTTEGLGPIGALFASRDPLEDRARALSVQVLDLLAERLAEPVLAAETHEELHAALDQAAEAYEDEQELRAHLSTLRFADDRADVSAASLRALNAPQEVKRALVDAFELDRHVRGASERRLAYINVLPPEERPPSALQHHHGCRQRHTTPTWRWRASSTDEGWSRCSAYIAR